MIHLEVDFEIHLCAGRGRVAPCFMLPPRALGRAAPPPVPGRSWAGSPPQPGDRHVGSACPHTHRRLRPGHARMQGRVPGRLTVLGPVGNSDFQEPSRFRNPFWRVAWQAGGSAWPGSDSREARPPSPAGALGASPSPLSPPPSRTPRLLRQWAGAAGSRDSRGAVMSPAVPAAGTAEGGWLWPGLTMGVNFSTCQWGRGGDKGHPFMEWAGQDPGFRCSHRSGPAQSEWESTRVDSSKGP